LYKLDANKQRENWSSGYSIEWTNTADDATKVQVNVICDKTMKFTETGKFVDGSKNF